LYSKVDKQNKFLIQFIIGLVFFCYIAHRLNWIFIYFSLSLFLAYFFSPLYHYLLSKGVRKSISILLIFLVILSFAIFILFFIIPNTINELNQLYREIPGLLSRFQESLLSFEPYFNRIMDSETLEAFVNNVFSEIQKELLTFSRIAIFTLSSFVTRFGFGIFIIPLILYYLLIDIDLFKDSLLIFVLPEKRKDFREIVAEIDKILSNFIRGRLVVCFIVGAMITFGLYLLNIKLFPQTNIQIKWPNDVLIDNRKVCGILTEMSTVANTIKWVIVGIGINANNDSTHLPEEIRENTLSLKEVSGQSIIRANFIRNLCIELEGYYELLKKGDSALILKEWKSYNNILGKRIDVNIGDKIITGKAIDISEKGALILKTDTGEIEEIISGSVLP
jgi:biotin-[acetyl-CoA-carboxylase] ligase BirA-like protein